MHNLVVNKVRAFGFTPCVRPPGAAAGSSAREYVRHNNVRSIYLFSLVRSATVWRGLLATRRPIHSRCQDESSSSIILAVDE